MFTNSTLNLTRGFIGRFASNGNVAIDDGGGVYASASTINIASNGFVLFNQAVDGGGIYSSGSTIQITSGRVNDNTTTGDGGGIYANDGTVTMNGGTINNNTTSTTTEDSDGGGIFATNTAYLDLGSGFLEDNQANNGGGVFVEDGSGVTFAWRSADDWQLC